MRSARVFLGEPAATEMERLLDDIADRDRRVAELEGAPKAPSRSGCTCCPECIRVRACRDLSTKEAGATADKEPAGE